MDNAFTLSLLIYSGRENPFVPISEAEFSLALHLVKKQSVAHKKSFTPNLGDIGFSFYSPHKIINLYPEMITVETRSGTLYLASDKDILRRTSNLFFSRYKGDDSKPLKKIINDHLFPL